ATGIRVRQSEISIMKYIGATDSFVRLPFVIEGILIGFMGAALPLVLLKLMYEKLLSFILTHFSALSDWLVFLSAEEIFRVLVPLSLLVGVGIGFLGSSLSVRKHLRTMR
ncbi:MAG: FtsX-like permease family protein, partial [Lachnospiraceae bacterium]|nr:FtsX-like permease family protein [Lachnospiraceae bacterium]